MDRVKRTPPPSLTSCPAVSSPLIIFVDYFSLFSVGVGRSESDSVVLPTLAIPITINLYARPQCLLTLANHVLEAPVEIIHAHVCLAALLLPARGQLLGLGAQARAWVRRGLLASATLCSGSGSRGGSGGV